MDNNTQLECLVLRSQLGDTEALEELFRRYQPKLRYFLYRLLQNRDSIEDTLQDVWLTVIRKIVKLNDPQAFPVWLFKIARNRAYEHSRKHYHEFPLEEENPPEALLKKEPSFTDKLASQIHRALDKIHPRHCEVLTLHFLEQMPYHLIAEVIGCSMGTVKSRIHYAKQSLRKELERDHG